WLCVVIAQTCPCAEEPVLPDDLLGPVSQTVEHLRSLPWAAHGLAGIALLAGLILWLIGRRVLKPIIVIIFALAGGGAGLLLSPLVGAAGGVGVYTGTVVGLALGAVIGLVLYRFSMAVGLGAVLGIAAPLTAAVVLSGVHPTSTLGS